MHYFASLAAQITATPAQVHFVRKAAIHAKRSERQLRGQTGLVQTRLLLTQHSFANSAQEIQ
jgi:hypothetical protein